MMQVLHMSGAAKVGGAALFAYGAFVVMNKHSSQYSEALRGTMLKLAYYTKSLKR
jgi:hypothetical protein